MKVQNMIGKNGRAIPNQFVITDDEIGVIYFQSYRSIIARVNNGKNYLDKIYWDYSRTTSKYRNQFLGMTTKEIKEKIKTGEIQLVNLN